MFLPAVYVEHVQLSTNAVDGCYVTSLWNYEIENCSEIQRLHRLQTEHIYPSTFQKMHVGAAIRFFSLKTATSALEVAVKERVLPNDALTTAHFIRIIYKWYSILTSQNFHHF